MTTNLLELRHVDGPIAVLGSNERRRYVDMQDCYIACDVLHVLHRTFVCEHTGALTPFFFRELADIHGWDSRVVEVGGKDPYELANALVECSAALLVFPRSGKTHAVDAVFEHAIAYAASLGMRVVRVPRLTHNVKEQPDGDVT
jgi:hypothetical protein